MWICFSTLDQEPEDATSPKHLGDILDIEFGADGCAVCQISVIT